MSCGGDARRKKKKRKTVRPLFECQILVGMIMLKNDKNIFDDIKYNFSKVKNSLEKWWNGGFVLGNVCIFNVTNVSKCIF